MPRSGDRTARQRPERGRAVPILRAERLVRHYGGRVVVDIEELELGAGEVLAVLGPNGAGKSTLFRLLLLLERADAGRILFEGRPARPGDVAITRRMAGVFQRPHLFAGSVRSNVEYGLRTHGIRRAERSKRVAEALGWLGLTGHADAPVHALSGGEAQRVALARALALQPDVLLLDEPTANLDVTAKRRFREDLERLVRSLARAALLITHDPTDAFALADRIAVMHDGRIVQTGPPEELVARPATPFVAAFTGAELLLDGVSRGGEDGLVTVELARGATIVAALSGGADGSPPGAGSPVHVAYRPEDVVLSTSEPPGSSTRNRFRVRVAGVSPAGGLVRVRLEGEVGLVALVTRQSARDLEITPGSNLLAQLKAAALRAFPAAG